MRTSLICLFISLLNLNLFAQVDHWETAVYGDDVWRYFDGASDPGTAWSQASFNDAAWSQGQGGFGYGDGDDNIIITTSAIFIRTDFTITDTAKIAKALMHVDYDDSFVAYINGIEVARANIGTTGIPPAYNEWAPTDHEAVLYNGGTPESFVISKNVLNGCLIPGNNVLAIEVHNVNATSSDLSLIPYLSLGITDLTSDYGQTPTWFVEPFDFSSSNLPIVAINTFGVDIPDDPKILCEIGIIYNGPGALNYVNDAPNEFLGEAMIEQRGETSQGFPKKSWFFETIDSFGNDLDVSFLNFPMEEDWILYGPYSDKTLLNNVITMKIGREMGHYNSRTRLVEVSLNGDYRGVYVLMEKIKRDDVRLDIGKLDTSDNTGSQLTGGYIFRIDKGSYDGWYSDYDVAANPGQPMYFQYFYPNENVITAPQKTYLQAYVDSFEFALADPTFTNQWGVRYEEYIDLRTFFDFFIMNEVGNNIDGYRLSSYFNKQKDTKGGKLAAGPFWDYNLAFGNGDYCDGEPTNMWQYLSCGQNGAFWWETFLTDTMYTRGLRCRWEELRQSTLSTPYIIGFIDSVEAELEDPADRNYQTYPNLGTYEWPNPFPWPSTYEGVVDELTVWLTDRLTWLDANIPGTAANCSDFDPPTLPIDTTASFVQRYGTEQMDVKIIPNPVVDEALVFHNSDGAIHHIEIYDNVGALIYRSGDKQGGMFKFNRGNLPSGMYYIKIVAANRIIGQQKMVLY